MIITSSVFEKLSKLSKWLDCFFRVPPSYYDRMLKEQQDIEDISNRLRDDIRKCRSLESTYTTEDRIRDLYSVYGRKAQVIACYDSLMLELSNRQKEIINNFKIRLS